MILWHLIIVVLSSFQLFLEEAKWALLDQDQLLGNVPHAHIVGVDIGGLCW